MGERVGVGGVLHDLHVRPKDGETCGYIAGKLKSGARLCNKCGYYKPAPIQEDKEREDG